MPKNCETCIHSIIKYSPIYKGLVETCEFDARKRGCEGQYEAKKEKKDAYRS